MTSQRMMTDAPVPLDEHVPTADTFIMMSGDWQAFEAMLALRGDRSCPRMAFFDGVIELMSPSRPHEGFIRTIDYLLGVYCEAIGVAFTGFGSWTHKNAAKKAGLEPDGCFVFGPNPAAARRADLAIEVVWTRGGLDKLEIYLQLKVREVWIWEKGSITVYILDGGEYRVVDRSSFLPDLDLALIARLATVMPTTAAAAELRAALAQPK